MDKEKNYQKEQINVTTVMAFLLGVKEEMFSHSSPERLEIFNRLKENSNAVIMRSLCNIRSNLMLNFSNTERKLVYELKNLDKIDNFIDDIRILNKHSVHIIKANYRANSYISDLNTIIINRIEGLRELFPEWLNWDYIKRLFIMTKGNKEEYIKAESCKYSAQRDNYPYRRYINWEPVEAGNILISDSKFLKIIYEQNGDVFEDKSKVLDASEDVKMNIYDFINNHNSVVIAVDCENSDAFKFAATLKQLDKNEINKVKKIILYDDIHTTPAWQYIDKVTSIPVEYLLVERVKEDKSLVDMKLCADVCSLHYKDGIESFIIVSSDSDYWGLISTLCDASFLVMIEYQKCGQDIKNALVNNGTYYCSIDDFCTGNIKELKTALLRGELENRIKDICVIDTHKLLDDIYTYLRLNAEPAERNNFYKKYILGLRLEINSEGIIKIKVPN